jgi:hypothetical protein
MSDPQARFAQTIAAAHTPEEGFAALMDLARALVPARLFTVTLIDMEAGVARRAFTSDAVAYPVSGTKPLTRDGFFQTIHEERRTYVENDIANDREHFTDHELIASLGCEAALNLPVVLRGDLAATVNILDARNSYPPEAVARLEAGLRVPAMLAVALAQG